MRTFDLTPLYRSTVGFDRLFSLLDQGPEGAAPGYPPYNIERTGDNEYRVTVAVAGFSEPELSIVAKENASYIATWLEVLKKDNRAIFAAAAHAQRAADYLNQKSAAAQVSETCAA